MVWDSWSVGLTTRQHLSAASSPPRSPHPTQRQAYAMAKFLFVLTWSPNHRLGRDYKALPVLRLDPLRLLTHFWLTHLWSQSSLWPISHGAPPQQSSLWSFSVPWSTCSLQALAPPVLDSSTQPSSPLGVVLYSTLSSPFLAHVFWLSALA